MLRVVALTALLLLAGAASAGAATLEFKRLGQAVFPAVASAQDGVVAYYSARGTVSVRRPSGPARTYATSPQCDLEAVDADALALRCNTPQGPAVVVMQLSDGALTPLQLPPGTPERVTSVGARWAIVDVRLRSGQPRSETTSLLVDWHTQRTIDLTSADPYGARRYLDLDSAEPGRRLCSPVRRIRDVGLQPPFLPFVKVGSWTLADDSPKGPFLQRCGSKTRKRFTDLGRVVLGQDFVGYRAGVNLVYRDLRSGTRYSAHAPGTDHPAIAAAGRRLVVSDSGVTGRYTIYSAAPQPG